MKHISLKVSDVIKNILPETIEKDLQDNEIICPTCHGLGVIRRKNPFGIEEEVNPNRITKVNWYDNESLTFCPDCYNGVKRLCEFCGKPIPKGYVDKCDCDTYKQKQVNKAKIKYKQRIDKATEIKPEDTVEWLYDDIHDKYYEDIGEFIDNIEMDYDYLDDLFFDELPEVLWVCYPQNISIDASGVIERACEDLHEDADENCDYKSLQKLLDDWCKEQSGTTTVYPEYKKYIVVKKEWFKDRL